MYYSTANSLLLFSHVLNVCATLAVLPLGFKEVTIHYVTVAILYAGYVPRKVDKLKRKPLLSIFFMPFILFLLSLYDKTMGLFVEWSIYYCMAIIPYLSYCEITYYHSYGI